MVRSEIYFAAPIHPDSRDAAWHREVRTDASARSPGRPAWRYLLGAVLNVVPGFGLGYLSVGSWRGFAIMALLATLTWFVAFSIRDALLTGTAESEAGLALAAALTVVPAVLVTMALNILTFVHMLAKALSRATGD